MNHRIFECKLHSLDIQGVCLSECRVKPKHALCGVLLLGSSCISPYKSLDVRVACSHNTEQKAQLASVFLTVCVTTPFEHPACSIQHLWPQIRQDYPLNLSILISGGKETNKDSPSNGEWSGKSSSLKSLLLATANCSLWKYCQGKVSVLKLLGTARRRGWEPRVRHTRLLTRCFLRVGLIGNSAQNGR